MLASSQQFCVKWNSYSSNLQNVFPRLLTSEHFVDITLACEGQMIKCHKVVLSACSTYFENLLIHNPCQHPIIFMKDMKHREVQALVDFMYKGEVNVSQEELNSLLRAAEALQIRGLCGSDHSNVGNQQNSPRQQVGENRLPAVSLPHDTVLSGRESPPFKRRRTVAEEQEQTSKVAPSQNNRASIGSSSSLMEVNNLPVAATPSSHNTFLETDSYSDHVENKKVIKQELDMENCYIEGEVEADGPDEDYGFEHQDDSDSNNREDVLPAPSLDQPGPSGLMSGQGIAALDKATSAVESGLPLDVHSALNYAYLSMRPPHKQYSPKALNQAVEDFQTGKFNSIRACARHHGVPMTTLHYRVKLKLRHSEVWDCQHWCTQMSSISSEFERHVRIQGQASCRLLWM
ncbi:centrosome-associated zinc finger protein CP190-like isoform X5 [Zootermopsis nevadensis]|uniref:centrosome-associated zinc finger protein CP190-like isoform X5 n=1 Tax=Zootermopsis nevadensis TaxID=136037 RepID=UPI000B8ECD1A|nr:centrosome-associated zinc finger protein CP190-like isoform X5 [Zootermopsis nevadensis]